MDDAPVASPLEGGDARAIETLARREASRLIAVARHILVNDEDAVQVVRDVLVSATQHAPEGGTASRASNELRRETVSAAVARLHARPHVPEEAIGDLLPRFLPSGNHVEQFRAWPAASDDAGSGDQTAALVRDAIQHVPESFRIVLLLHDVEGMSIDEIAAVLATTPNPVRIRLHRARLGLRTLLAPQLQGVA